MLYKSEMRKKLRNKRGQLDKNSIKQASERVALQVIHLSAFIRSQTIALYLPQDNELDTTPIIDHAIALKKALYLPAISSDNSQMLSFYSYHRHDPLILNRFNILEPDTNHQTAIDRFILDIIFVPLVGFDRHCHRLGRGGGYYDRTLNFSNDTSEKRPITIGLAYEFQKIIEIKPSKWDIPLDYVMTEKNIYQRKVPM